MTFFFDDDVPDDLCYLLIQLGHRVAFLRDVLPRDTPDADVLEYARQHGLILVSCNRDDFVALGSQRQHPGIVIVIRRRSRAHERAAQPHRPRHGNRPHEQHQLRLTTGLTAFPHRGFGHGEPRPLRLTCSQSPARTSA